MAIKVIYIDLFCGAGGTSTGVHLARHEGEPCAKVIACVNHDANAIASHAANHPDALHYTEDIRTLELSPLATHVALMRRLYPEAFVALWASLECTNFSKAKGGQARDADSRTLAEHLFRYIEALNPDYIQIENVEEFMSWGDLDENGKPISKDAGRCYRQWVDNVRAYGYGFDHRILNAANYGAYTSRKRFFGIFAKKGLPIVFPEPTHAKNPVASDLFGQQLCKWKPVREVLDLNDEGESIFDRKKPLVEASLSRVHAGLVKFVAGGKDAFLVKYNSMSRKGVYIAPGIDEPCPTVATQNRLGVVKVNFIQQRHSGNPESKVVSIDRPARTLTSTGGNMDVVSAKFLCKHFSGRPEGKSVSVEGPAGTITTRDHHAFVSAYYGHGFNSSIERPAPTVTTKDRFQLVRPFVATYYTPGYSVSVERPAPTVRTKDCLTLVQPFIDQQFGNGRPASVRQPLGTVTTVPKYNLVTPWVMNTNFNNVGSSLDDPAHTVTANRKWHYLVNPQFASAGASTDRPCFTLIARMDKRPPQLVTIDTGTHTLPSFIKPVDGVLVYEIYGDDTPMMVQIKEFMALYGLVDIKMRMLRIGELKRIMGFPENYVLVGTQGEQKKFIGNAVEVNMARVLCEALVRKIYELNITPQQVAA